MSKVFLSYRRDDSAGYAQAIYNQLVQRFSKDRVFMDVDTIEPGVDFVRVIEKAVGECDVLVALIGKRWVGGEASATSRLDNAKDFVRLEISTALARDIRVIPVLLDGMAMPDEDILPAGLRPIARRHAIEISNTRFNFDVERLITAVQSALGETGKSQRENTSAGRTDEHVTRKPQLFAALSTPLMYGMVAGLVLIILSLAIWWPKRQQTERVETEPPKETVVSAPEKKPEGQKTIIEQSPSSSVTLGTQDSRTREISPSARMVGQWKADVVEDGVPIQIRWNIRSNGSTTYNFITPNGTIIKNGGWRYSDGGMYEELADGGRAQSTIRWINSNAFELTIVDNGIPMYSGLKRMYYRQ